MSETGEQPQEVRKISNSGDEIRDLDINDLPTPLEPVIETTVKIGGEEKNIVVRLSLLDAKSGSILDIKSVTLQKEPVAPVDSESGQTRRPISANEKGSKPVGILARLKKYFLEN